ncbi:prevent-host-death family protein [mine drainage metagenome]|uniref:Prevent-host-death family protein n=1 Tax=mine drainage metagenome TaxID=410659 RepID=T1B860_9ZZZZ
MVSVNIKDTQVELLDIIHRLVPGDEIIITENERPIARLLPMSAKIPRPARRLGTLRGTVKMASDFDAPLEDFLEYEQ